MKAFIERIEMFPEKRKDGSWIKKIVFNFPVPIDGEEVKELPLETETTVEAVLLLTKLNVERHIEVDVSMDELDVTAAESKATYDEIKAYVLEKYGLKVSSLYISKSSGSAGWMWDRIITCQRRKMPKCRSAHQKRKRQS